MIVASTVGLLLFPASLLNLVASMIGPLRLDLLLLLTVGTFTLFSVRYRNYRIMAQNQVGRTTDREG